MHNAVHNTVGGRVRGARRGSTIIVAVGILAVLALVAVSYAVAVRSDRAGVAAYENGVDLESASQIVRDEIGSLLAADLFGNKIVTRDVPVSNGGLRIWPRMFEDGEFADVPQTAPGSFDPRAPDLREQSLPAPGSRWAIEVRSSPIGPYFPSSPNRDDAWLSNVEPFNPDATSPRDGQANLGWTTWGQLTNLRSAWRWVRRDSNDRTGLWLRDDGRFADLGMFFVSDFAVDPARTPLRGDPGADLSFDDRTNGLDAFSGFVPNGPLAGLSTTPTVLGGLFATDVFQYQLHQMSEVFLGAGFGISTPVRTAGDERFFTDTDGDLRPDARWQVVDALDGTLGLRWVVAARVIDNSAMVNVNTALEFQGLEPATQNRVGDGRTPADVDLSRLIQSARLGPDLRTAGAWAPPVNGLSPQAEIDLGVGDIFPAFPVYSMRRDDGTRWSSNPVNQHLVEQLALDSVTNALEPAIRAPLELALSSTGTADDVVVPTDIILGASGTLPPPPFTTRLQRYLASRSYGVSPLQPTSDYASPYPLTDEVDLRAFFGVNNDAVVSKVEQRFDYDRLDDATGEYLGPLRGKERTATMRNFAMDTDPALGQVRPSVEMLATDIRHNLTTVNGAADFSPVPVLNAWTVNGVETYDRSFNTKVKFLEVPRLSPAKFAATPQIFARAQRDKADVVRRTFEAVAWALAPLAGHTPLMAPLDTTHTGWFLANTDAAPTAPLSRFFYGGDSDPAVRGPADLLTQRTSRDPGAAYAILRALSLAVNLADATDDDRIDPAAPLAAPTGETRDLPTVARLYNVPHPDPFLVDPSASGDERRYGDQGQRLAASATPLTDQVVRAGVGFSWGDLRAAGGGAATFDGDSRVPESDTRLLPDMYVGTPVNGVTVVGLDRQPFLRQVATTAFYADRAAFLPDQSSNATFTLSDQLIDANDPAERVGVIIAWELGNPWPDPITLDDYTLAISNNAEVLSATMPTGTIIPPGESRVFFVVHWQNGASAYDETNAKRLMLLNRDLWVDEIDGRDLTVVDLNPGAAAPILMIDDVFSDPMTPAGIPEDGVPFQGWGDGVAVGLLLLDNKVAGAGTLVVDRLSSDPGTSGVGIPRVANGGVSAITDTNTNPNVKFTGITSASGSIYRRTEAPSAGFPAWVIERPTINGVIAVDAEAQKQTWLVPNGSSGFGIDPPPLPGSQGASAAVGLDVLGVQVKGMGPYPVALPSFQLFVPNTELRYASESLQLTAFTHMYVHAALDPEGAVLGDKVADVAAFGPGSWRTVSEQLGSDEEIYRDSASNGTINPYLGTLDPTRFMLYSQTAGPQPASAIGMLGPVSTGGAFAGLPETLALPLALRVPDCFGALWTPDWRGGSRLVQGTMNINTATQRALRMLPLVDPYAPIGSLQPQSDQRNAPSASPAPLDWRVPLILAYRDRVGTATSTDVPADPAKITGLFGTDSSTLRYVDGSVEPDSFDGGVSLSRGFATAAELAILGRWNTGVNSGDPALTGYGTNNSFLELGVAGIASDASPEALDVRLESSMPTVGAERPTPLAGGSLATYDGDRDPEERLALYRAVSNIVTSRSDVFTAYFKVRAYSPADIEAVAIEEPATDQQIDDYLEQLRPQFEARYLAVYDRSTVRTPLDRPRVLLFVRLPD